MLRTARRIARLLATISLGVGASAVLAPGAFATAVRHGARRVVRYDHVVRAAAPSPTATPITHLVVIFQDGVSFDHYFGTYPDAANTDGSTFHAGKPAPVVNGLTPSLLMDNPNEYNPERLTHSQALTCAQNPGYTAGQNAFDMDKMDEFVQSTDTSTCTGQPVVYGSPGLVMDYYDGNTVTGLWHYAKRFAMSDNSYATQFGPATPGSINVISGQTYGAEGIDPATGSVVSDSGVVGSPNAEGVGTDYGEQAPYYDDCSSQSGTLLEMTGTNIGDLLNTAGVTWGWFQGGFTPTGTNASGLPVCGSENENLGGIEVANYVPSEEPFQYYQSTANPEHLPPTSVAKIGHQDQANHQYALSDFFKALHAGNLPAVSYLKADAYQDGNAGNSDPLDEQTFLVRTINQIEHTPFWHSTAIVVNYADSGGWYDQLASPLVNPSADPATDTLDGPGVCGQGTPLDGEQDRCGFGPRLPMMVISPWAKPDYVDQSPSDQASIVTFIEDNWLGGARIGGGSFDALGDTLDNMFDFSHADGSTLFLNRTTGEPVPH